MKTENAIGIVICTHNRVVDAKINQEIIRYHWPKFGLYNTVIIHSYNGKREWYPQAYLENDILRSNNSSLGQGNSDLIDTGINYIYQQYPNIKYAIVINADTWLLNPEYIKKCIYTMNEKKIFLAASSYVGEKSEFFRGGLASDFFIADVPALIENRMFPLNYKEFHDQYWDLILYYCGDMNVILEKLLMAKFSKSLQKIVPYQNPADVFTKKLLRLKEREPFYKKDSDSDRIWHWPEAGVVSDHNLTTKKEMLKQYGIFEGTYINQLFNDISYKSEDVPI